jgi:hypothetical protein
MITPPSAISIGAAPTPAAPVATSAGKVGAAGDGGSSSTTLAVYRRGIGRWRRALHGIAQTRSPPEQLLRTEIMTARHLRDYSSLGQALGDNRRHLLLRRPLAPTLNARDCLDPLWTRSRRRHLMVSHYGQHYGQNDACSWAGILPDAYASQNVGTGHRLHSSRGWKCFASSYHRRRIYPPIGVSELDRVAPGEFYCDDGNSVLCRLEVRQVEKTKIRLSSVSAFYILQGNVAIDQNLLDDAFLLLKVLTETLFRRLVRQSHTWRHLSTRRAACDRPVTA